ncbi:hypothetical protein EV126DRAFT_415055, partial [Verticillium dahliae]
MPYTAAEGTRDVGASSLSLPAPTPDQHNRQPASQQPGDAGRHGPQGAHRIRHRQPRAYRSGARRPEGNNPDVALRFHGMMFAACEANGTPIDTFLPPPGMETLLRERLGTRHGLLEQGPHDGGDPEVRTLVCAFVGDMVKGSICLGDGPRWTADRATAMLDAFSRAGACVIHAPVSALSSLPSRGVRQSVLRAGHRLERRCRPGVAD